MKCLGLMATVVLLWPFGNVAAQPVIRSRIPARDIVLASSPSSAQVRAAIQALRNDPVMGNVPVSAISAAFFDLNSDGSPELFIRLSGDYCGSGGCQAALYERGINDWRKIALWQLAFIGVSDTRPAGWRDVIVDHSVRWRYVGGSYVEWR